LCHDFEGSKGQRIITSLESDIYIKFNAINKKMQHGNYVLHFLLLNNLTYFFSVAGIVCQMSRA
jgi:hypothetical protein